MMKNDLISKYESDIKKNKRTIANLKVSVRDAEIESKALIFESKVVKAALDNSEEGTSPGDTPEMAMLKNVIKDLAERVYDIKKSIEAYELSIQVMKITITARERVLEQAMKGGLE